MLKIVCRCYAVSLEVENWSDLEFLYMLFETGLTDFVVFSEF